MVDEFEINQEINLSKMKELFGEEKDRLER